MKKSFFLLTCTSIILGLVPLLWFTDGNALLGADLGWLALDRTANFFEHLYTWKNTVAFGLDGSSLIPPTISFNLYLLVTDVAGMSFAAAEKLLFVLIMALLNASAAFAAWQFGWKLDTHARLSASVAMQVFMTFNFFTLVLWHNLIIGLVVALACALLILGIMVKSMRQTDRSAWLYVGLLAAASLFTSVFGMNPPAVLGIVVAPTALWVFVMMLLHRKDRRFAYRILGISFGGLVFSVLVNAWWILPLALQTMHHAVQPEFTNNINGILARNSEHLSMGNLLKLSGYWGLYTTSLTGLPTFAIADIYTPAGTLMSFAGYGVVALAGLGVFFWRHDKKIIGYIALLAIFGLFFGKGVHEPLGNLYQIAVNHVPGFWIFRSPYYKLFPNFVFAAGLSFSLGAGALVARLPRRASMVVFALVLAPVVSYGYPMLNGDVMEDRYQQPETVRAYEDVRTWLAENAQGARVFLLPQEANSYLTYTSGYDGTDYAYNIIPGAAGGLGGGGALTHDFVRFIHYRLYKDGKISPYYWHLLGTRYVIQRNDVDWASYPKHLLMNSPEDIAASLTASGLTLIQQFGDWDIYEVPETITTPDVEVFTDMTWVQGNIRTWEQLIDNDGADVMHRFYYFADLDPAPLAQPPDDARIYIKLQTTSRENLVEHKHWIFHDDTNTGGLISTNMRDASWADNVVGYRVHIPRTDTYDISVALEYGDDKGTLHVALDGDALDDITPYDRFADDYERRQTHVGRLDLEKGDHIITLRNSAGDYGDAQTVDYILLTADGEDRGGGASITNTTTVSPVQQRLAYASESSAYIHFAQSYHPQWVLEGNDATHVLSQGYANGWIVPAAGVHKVRLRYTAQRWFYAGIAVSLVSILAFALLILYTKSRFFRNK